jgi:lipoprotein signal peptidase
MEFSNRITFTVEAQHSIVEGHKIPFNSNMLREIFHNNKGASFTSIKFTQEGLLKLEFEFKEENTKTTYFVVRKADY